MKIVDPSLRAQTGNGEWTKYGPIIRLHHFGIPIIFKYEILFHFLKLFL